MIRRDCHINPPVFLRVFYRTLILAFCFLGFYSSVNAQDDGPRPRRGSRVINDTLRQVYGPRTSHYYFEKDVFLNREQYYEIDTLIQNFHRFTYVQKNEYY